MTQTPSRDWQKDMEMAHTARYEYDISHLNNVLDSLFYWLQEAKIYKQSYEGTLTAWEAEKARADAAEAREQRLKEGLEDMMPNMWPEMRVHFQVLLSTLYPDTPAPKEGE